MTVLAFETSGSVLSLTLLIHADAEPRVLHMMRDTGLHHAEHLAASARDLLAAAGSSVDDVDLVACTGGPGSFTGLRIGMATAKGFAAARNVPFIAVPTLDIWAEIYRYWPGVVAPVLDAKKRRFYAALYAGAEKLTGDLDEAPESILELAQGAAGRLPPGTQPIADPHPILIAGPAAADFAAAVDADLDATGVVVAPPSDNIPSYALARIARERYVTQGPAPTGIGPSYVRKSDAELGT